MDYIFRPAVRKDIPLRVLLIGESGDGKTYTGLAVAHHLLHALGEQGPVGVIDSEIKGRGAKARGTAELYAGEYCLCETCRGQGVRFDFVTLLLPEGNQHPDDYLKAMAAAEKIGCKALVIDSITHAWMTLLAQVDALKAQNPRKDPWLVATPIHRTLVEAFKTYNGHLICTVRSKEKIDKSNKLPGGGYASLGQLPEFRKGIEYEFDVALFLSGARGAVVKTRASVLENQTYVKPGGKLAQVLVDWAIENREETAAKDQKADTAPQNGSPERAPVGRQEASPRGGPDPTQGGQGKDSTTTRTESAPAPTTEPGFDLPALKARIIAKAKQLPNEVKGRARKGYTDSGDDKPKLEALERWIDGQLEIAAKAEQPPEGPMVGAGAGATDSQHHKPPRSKGGRGFNPPSQG